MDDTGCVIVIEHKSCTGTPSTETPCPICGYDGTQTKPTEPENPNPDVAEVNGTKYKTLAEAIKAANGANIKLLTIFGENVVVGEANIKAGVILGNGATINAIPYPSNWVADRNGIPLTMEAGEITLKDGALAQFSASSVPTLHCTQGRHIDRGRYGNENYRQQPFRFCAACRHRGNPAACWICRAIPCWTAA